MNLKSLIILLVLPLVFQGAHAISQVGSKSIGSETDMFSMEVPMRLPEFVPLPNNEVKLDERLLTGNRPELFTYYFIPFVNVYNFPDWSKVEISDWYINDAWFEVLTEDCRLSFIKLTNTAIKGVSTWGKGRGVVIIGQRSKWVQRNILTMLQDVKLKPGACSWN